MNAYELLDLFNRHSIALEVDGDRLRCKAPRGFMTEELVADLKRLKREIIAILAGSEDDGGEIARRPGGEADLPLSFSQRQLWFLDQLEPGNPFYSIPTALRFEGKLDVPALERALNEIVRRHEVLRTTFRAVDGEPRQVIRPTLRLTLGVTDLGGLPPPERQALAREAAEADARAPFDLAEGPLIRTSLYRLADDEHLWLLNLHHIVADGWSVGVLLQELAALYAAYVQGRPSPLPELPVQYADYTLWQRERLKGDALQGQVDYWKRQLAGAPALLDMPADRPRPAVQTFRGATHAVTTGADAVRALCRRTGGTLFGVLAAALAVLLWRHGAQDDVSIGTPFANRNRREIEPLIGHFVNTLVIRCRPDPRKSFAELLEQVRGDVLDAHAHQDVPFDQVVEALNPERHTSHSPLFQVMLVLQNAPGGAVEWPGLTLHPFETSSGTAKFDLMLEVSEGERHLRSTFEYNTDLFDRATIEALAGRFGRLLERVAAEPDRPLGEIDLLGEAERHRLLVEWNRTEAAYPQERCIHELFEAQAKLHPDAPAVTFEGRSLSYGALNARANRLARHLRTLGVGPDRLVAIRAERSPEMVVALLAVLKAGGAYLPLDPSYPAERLAFMLADAAPVAVVTDGSLGTPSVPVPVVDLGAEASWAGLPDTDLDRGGLTPRNLAYVIYTSGSTGTPKGVMVEHAGLVNLVLWTRDAFGFGPKDALLLKTPFSFDASVWEFFSPLATGARLVLARPGGHMDPEYLASVIREERVTVVQFVPSVLQLFLDREEAAACAGLTDVFCGGGELTPALARHLRSALPRTRLHNVYGPTEATVDAAAWTIEPADPVEEGRIPIGRPVANTRIYLLDERMEPVPTGVAGEIWIGGAGVARGYLNRPELTGQRFVASPFVAGDRLYRTGDLARRRPDGSLEFLGRNDFQVKVRGFRIELGEIEARLLEHPGMREAVVLAREDRLVAYYAAAPGVEPEALRARLASVLPDYMVPAACVRLDALPLTPNGKPDREALRAIPDRDARSGQVNLANPRDHVEMALYRIWKDLLIEPRIGIRDSFFSLGGTSISAIKMAHQVGRKFGVSVPVRQIISHPTIEALGGWIRAGAEATSAGGSLIEFRPGDGTHNVVCVHPAGGTAFCYLSLAKMLPESCGVYGIQSPGLNPGEAFLPTVEAMAEAYLALIEPLASKPLVVTGLSFGGLVAYEMTRRLALAGRDRAVAVLLDTQGSDDPAYRARMAPVDMPEFRDKLVKFNGMYPGIEDDQIERYFNVYNHNRMTVADYECPSQTGRVVLVQAQEGRDRAFLHELRRFWRRRAGGGFLATLVRGDHWEMLETAEVLRVSRTIRRELQHLGAGAGPSVRRAALQEA
ncbi:amino acid adenylation domain-containing protein [Arenibaculum sp.]|uniref:non-ribosomal peptide synthetase n=1 Tax=Arenibaculum sp. TaxID=2865862 RepID=UPI002E108F2E|nr:amino acid adenylation domain-containing protein [Arenibaculum sp.]